MDAAAVLLKLDTIVGHIARVEQTLTSVRTTAADIGECLNGSSDEAAWLVKYQSRLLDRTQSRLLEASDEINKLRTQLEKVR